MNFIIARLAYDIANKMMHPNTDNSIDIHEIKLRQHQIDRMKFGMGSIFKIVAIEF